jgi:hypothetical protein
MTDSADAIKVLIVNEEGQYLCGTSAHWEFTDDRAKARVFDYIEDNVADQVQLVRHAYRAIWIAVRLDPAEAYEFCDKCGARMTSLEAFFNGSQFFCAYCGSEDASLKE